MTSPGALPEVTCPGCSGLDWARGGFALHADGPRVDVESFEPLAPAEGWHCRTCGHPLEDDRLAGALSRLERVHEA